MLLVWAWAAVHVCFAPLADFLHRRILVLSPPPPWDASYAVPERTRIRTLELSIALYVPWVDTWNQKDRRFVWIAAQGRLLTLKVHHPVPRAQRDNMLPILARFNALIAPMAKWPDSIHLHFAKIVRFHRMLDWITRIVRS